MEINVTTTFSMPHSLLSNAFNGAIACLAILLNTMVIVVMTVRQSVFKSWTNRLILHQSVIDAVGGFVFFLHTVVQSFTERELTRGDISDEAACRLWYSNFLLWSVSVTSTYNIMVISIERFVATCYPVRHRNKWTVSKLKAAVAAVWSVGFIHGSHYILMYEILDGSCQFVTMVYGLQVFVATIVLGVECVVPVAVMVYCYARILIMLKRRTAKPAKAWQAGLDRSRRSVLTATLLVAVMFVVCWTPMQIIYIQKMFFCIPWNVVTYIALLGLLACNMCVNPVIYCFKYPHFRTQLRLLLRMRCSGQTRVHPLSPVTITNEPPKSNAATNQGVRVDGTQ